MNDELRRASQAEYVSRYGEPTNGITGTHMVGWHKGVEWLYAHLAGACEFDEKAAFAHARQMDDPDLLKMARWQHSQMAARVGKAETERACVLVYLGKLETQVSEAESRVALAEDFAVREVKRMQGAFLGEQSSVLEGMRERIKELESQVDVSNHNRKIVGLQERVKELEAKLAAESRDLANYIHSYKELSERNHQLTVLLRARVSE